MMAGLNSDSDSILHLLKPGSVCAEIGVWEGHSSVKFFKTNPKMLYLVDPYSTDGHIAAQKAGDPTFKYETYINAYSHIAGGKGEEAYMRKYDKVHAKVVKIFEGKDNVKVCRQKATDWFNEYKGEKLDWIYVDGDHSYTGVITDLENCRKIMKDDGIILGDDYKWDSLGDKAGVKKAVNEFVDRYGCSLQRFGRNQFRITKWA
jgi:hypothetical protein